MRNAALLILSVAMATSAVAGGGEPASSNADVPVIKASRKCFSSVVNATGYIVPRATAVVMFNAPGFRFAEVPVKEGDTVRRDETVAVAVAVASPPGPSGADAAARIPIKSLASGIVLQRSVKVGDLSSQGAGPLFTLAIDGDMEAVVDVPSVHVLELEPGQIARLSMDDGHDLGARVRVVPAEINQLTQVGQARLSIDGSEPPMTGRFVRAAIDAHRSCGIAVPLSALTHGSDGVRLQVVKGEEIETRLVKLGLRSEAEAEIIEGVADGDLVIADAGTSLEEGDRVHPIFSDLEEAQ